MSILQGKGMYLWRVSKAEKGNPQQIAQVAKAAGLSHVMIKVADGSAGYNYTPDNKDNVPAVVEALREVGVSPWGWQYIYGRNPQKEAERAIQRVNELGLDGFVVNAEKEFKFTHMELVARTYMFALRQALGDRIPIGFSSYRYPSYHRPLPFEVFLEYSDINMPQVYWVQANNPEWQLQKSIDEYSRLRVVRPIVPTGAAYSEHGWAATPTQVQRFLQAVVDLGLPACNFWEWYWARLDFLGLWPVIQQFPMHPSEPEPAAGDPPEVDLEALIHQLKARGLPYPV